jgi:hypothetical protein
LGGLGWVGGWLEELELKQALQFSFGLGLCNKSKCFQDLQTLILKSGNKITDTFLSQYYDYLIIFNYLCILELVDKFVVVGVSM